MNIFRTATGEEVEVESDRVLTLDDIEAITGKKPDPLVTALVSESSG